MSWAHPARTMLHAGWSPTSASVIDCIWSFGFSSSSIRGLPYTSKNSAAALLFDETSAERLDDLVGTLRDGLIRESADGSDPGLCVTREVPAAVSEFGRRCQREVVTQAEAAALASAHDILLEGTWRDRRRRDRRACRRRVGVDRR